MITVIINSSLIRQARLNGIAPPPQTKKYNLYNATHAMQPDTVRPHAVQPHAGQPHAVRATLCSAAPCSTTPCSAAPCSAAPRSAAPCMQCGPMQCEPMQCNPCSATHAVQPNACSTCNPCICGVISFQQLYMPCISFLRD